MRLHIRKHEGGAGAEIVVIGIHIPSVLMDVEAVQPGESTRQVRDALLARLAFCDPQSRC